MDLHEIMSNRTKLTEQLATQEGQDEFIHKLSSSIEANIFSKMEQKQKISSARADRREKLSAAAKLRLDAIFEAGWLEGVKQSGALSEKGEELYATLMEKANEMYKISMQEMVEGAEAAEDLTEAEIEAAARDLVGGDGSAAAALMGEAGDEVTAEDAKEVLMELVHAADESGEKTSSDRAASQAYIADFQEKVSAFTYRVYDRAVAFQQVLNENQ